MSNFLTKEDAIQIMQGISKKTPQGIMIGNTTVGHITWQMYLMRDYLKLDGTPLANASNDYDELLKFAQDNSLITSDTTDKSLFKYDSTNDVLTLPNFMDKGLWSGNTVEEKEAGLPNITGGVHFRMAAIPGGTDTGAFKVSNTSIADSIVENSGSSVEVLLDFDASNSNSIYGNSTTVQPPAITLIPQIRYKRSTTYDGIELGENYSAEERRIGTWIDGKPLYQKTFIGVCSSSVFNIDVSSLNIDKCIDISGLIDVANYSWTGNLGNYYLDGSNYGSFYYENTGNLSQICILFGSTIPITGESYYITIKYTKT